MTQVGDEVLPEVRKDWLLFSGWGLEEDDDDIGAGRELELKEGVLKRDIVKAD